ncbi:hypothetical protein SNE40_017643 [Patella caerulea]
MEWPKPEHMALVGPIIRAEVGDVLKIRFKNKASRAYSIYSHGVSYEKPSEGALYMDGSSGYGKEDDVVLPGNVHNYTWFIKQGPSESDPPCIPYVYHSHINLAKDTNSGLIGVLLICKKGTLNYDHTRNDVSTELVVLSKAFDENHSWYIDHNLKQCGSIVVCKRTRKMGETHWVESNIMRSINGRSFSNLEGLSACAGDKVAWYFLSFGDEMDVHSTFVEGQVMDIQHQRKSTASVYPGTAEAAFMIPHGPGSYRVSSMMEDHYEDGMSAMFVVNDCLYPNASLPVTTKTRMYFLSIEEDAWDYAPSGRDQLKNTTLTEGSISNLFFDPTAKIGGKYIKARYIQYMDETFLSTVDRKPSEKHMGIIGPVIRVEEGDELIIYLKNKAKKTFSFTAQSLYSTPENSGYAEGLFAGSERQYKFQVPTNVTKPGDPDCVVRMYFSATDYTRDVNAGLIGPLLICKKGKLQVDNQPVDNTTKEFFLLFKMFDENKAEYLDTTMTTYGSAFTHAQRQEEAFMLSNRMMSINGYSFANIPGLDMCSNDNVVWYIMTIGHSTDDVSPHFQGQTFADSGRNSDTVGLTSGSTKTVRMVPDMPGTWALLSVVNEQDIMGMNAKYTVNACQDRPFYPRDNIYTNVQSPTYAPMTRRFAIAATEVNWDYASIQSDFVSGIGLNDPRADGNIYIKHDKNFIGTVYKKAVYKAYMDVSFTKPVTRGFDAGHLGILGPVIQAEVGDFIEILFHNNASRPYSMYAHGLMTNKSNEGYFYSDGRPITGQHSVAPGQTVMYRWYVAARSGPGKGDPNCVPHLYYSAVDRTRDVATGLVGPMEICRKGTLDQSNRRRDVSREFHLLFKMFNENLSWYLDDNVKQHAPGRLGTQFDLDSKFEESNKKYSINGELYGNLKGLMMLQNETVVWYLYALGTKTGLNTVHFNGNTVVRQSKMNKRTDTIEVYPGMSEAVTMFAENAGSWMVNSNVDIHFTSGMIAPYKVFPL